MEHGYQGGRGSLKGEAPDESSVIKLCILHATDAEQGTMHLCVCTLIPCSYDSLLLERSSKFVVRFVSVA